MRGACTLVLAVLAAAGTAAAKDCKVSFEAAAEASFLPVASPRAQHIRVGTIIQDCTASAGYVLIIRSQSCPSAPSGAKLTDKQSSDYVRYSVEFDNAAAGGGMTAVSGLLAQSCDMQVGRDEGPSDGVLTSDIFLDFTGSPSLAVGIYEDSLSVLVNMK